MKVKTEFSKKLLRDRLSLENKWLKSYEEMLESEADEKKRFHIENTHILNCKLRIGDIEEVLSKINV